MKANFKFDVQSFDNYSGSVLNNVVFNHCSNLIGFNIEIVTFIISYLAVNIYEIKVFDGTNTLTFSPSTISDLVQDEFSFDAEVTGTNANNVLYLYRNNVIMINNDNYTTLFLYKQNCENDVIDKTTKLTPVAIVDGKFNSAIGYKNITIDIVGYTFNFNYVLIPALSNHEMYYYVDSIELVSSDITRLHLKEDVLMTWHDLIKSQDAFITRYENATDKSLVDTRKPVKDVLQVVLDTSRIVNTPSTNSLKNITLDYTNSSADSNSYENILIVSVATSGVSSQSQYAKYTAPSGSGLPDIVSSHSDNVFFSFITPQNFIFFDRGYQADAPTGTNMLACLWLPFNPTTAFDLQTQNKIYIGEKFVGSTGTFLPTSSTSSAMASKHSSFDGVCPYLILKDFTYTLSNPTYLDYEPYTHYEIYITFVGWIKVEANKIINKRLLVYYAMDLTTGLATAYLYSYTDKVVIWSGTCQIGLKIDLTATNQLENIRQKQSNDTNMILGLISSAVSIGIGVATENPIAITGGVLSAGKTIASNVNANNQIFERSQISFASADSALHAPQDIQIRRSYHEPIAITENTYKHLQGYPYNQYGSLSLLTGYVEIGEIHFDPKNNIIYQDEISEIVSLLQNGVIF